MKQKLQMQQELNMRVSEMIPLYDETFLTSVAAGNGSGSTAPSDHARSTWHAKRC
jgi:hypothetical protein